MSSVQIHRPESTPSDDDFVSGIPEPEVAFRPAPSPRPSLEEAVEMPEDEDERKSAERLNKFLSAKQRDIEPETKELFVKSLDTTVVIRELTNREAEDVFEMFQEAMRPGARNRKRVLEVNAHLISKALMEPNVGNPIVLAKLQNKFGEGISLPELILKIFKPGEIIQLGDAIMTLSGTEEDAITEAKN